MSASRHTRHILAWLVVWLGYLGLTIWLTWPLVTELGGKLPCPDPTCVFDTVYSAWVMSWLSHALTTAPWHVADANIFFPASQALYYGPAGFGAVPYALPAFVATGNAAVALNVVLLSCASLTALALHWVVWRWTGSMTAGFIAAWTLLMNRWYLWGVAATVTHLTPLQYFPLIVFLTVRPSLTRRQTLVLLVLIVIQCLTDLVYIAPAVIAPLGMLALNRIARPAWRPSGWRLLCVLAAVPLCLAPFALGYVQVRLQNPALGEQTHWNTAGMFLSSGMLRADLARLFWRSPLPEVPAPISVGLAVIGLVAAGGLTGVFKRWRGAGSGLARPWAHASLWVLVGTFISLTPVTVLDLPGGDGTWTRTRIPVPPLSFLASHTSLYHLVRVPDRLGVGAMIGICLLAGLAAGELARAVGAVRGPGGPIVRVTLAVAVAVLVYHVPPGGLAALPPAYPLGFVPVIDPALVRQLLATPGPLLELPALEPKLKFPAPHLNARAMYRSTLHWRPLVNGYASYWPAGFAERMQLTDALPAPPALRRLVCDTGVRTILVSLPFSPADRQAVWRRAVTEPPPGLNFIGQYPGQLLFTVSMPLPGQPGGPNCADLTGASDDPAASLP
jgi:hypothetical protein